MRFIPPSFILLLPMISCDNQNTTSMNDDFSPDSYRDYPRVRQAYAQKGDIVKTMLSKRAIDFDSLNVFMRAFKQEQILEIWGKNIMDEKWLLNDGK